MFFIFSFRIRPSKPDEFFLPEVAKKPVRSEWVTLTINRGKRYKLSKKDVVGFLFQKGGLEKDDLGNGGKKKDGEKEHQFCVL